MLLIMMFQVVIYYHSYFLKKYLVHIKNYIHRCGRTARAGKKGNSYTLIRPEEVFFYFILIIFCKDSSF